MNSQLISKSSLFSIFSAGNRNIKNSAVKIPGQNPELSAFGNLFAILFSVKEKGERTESMVQGKSKIKFSEINENIKSEKEIRLYIAGGFQKPGENTNVKKITGNKPSSGKSSLVNKTKGMHGTKISVENNSVKERKIVNTPVQERQKTDIKQLKEGAEDSVLNADIFTEGEHDAGVQNSTSVINTSKITPLRNSTETDISNQIPRLVNKKRLDSIHVKKNAAQKKNPAHLINKGRKNNVGRLNRKTGEGQNAENGINRENQKFSSVSEYPGIKQNQKSAVLGDHPESEIIKTQQKAPAGAYNINAAEKQPDAVSSADVKTTQGIIMGKDNNGHSVEIKTKDADFSNIKIDKPVHENIRKNQHSQQSEIDFKIAGKESLEGKLLNGKLVFVHKSDYASNETKSKQIEQPDNVKENGQSKEASLENSASMENMHLQSADVKKSGFSSRKINTTPQGIRSNENINTGEGDLKIRNAAREISDVKGTSPLPAERPLIIQTTRAIVNMNSTGETKLTIMLTPPAMGKMKIELKSNKDGVDVKLIVEIKEVKGIMDSAVSDMKEAISKNGVNLRNVFVELTPDQQNDKDFGDSLHSNRDSQNFNHGRGSSHGKAENRPFSDDKSEKDYTRYFGYNSMEIIA
ncbi:flagellar hook-length control protein FliK [bacterium]|nr:flagellar hook-length control protein FliK [bacterium]